MTLEYLKRRRELQELDIPLENIIDEVEDDTSEEDDVPTE